MNLIILHGSGVVAKLNRLAQIKDGFNALTIQEFSSKDISFEKVLVEISTPNLFSNKRIIILDSYTDKIDLKSLPKDENLTVVFKFDKSLLQTSLFIKSAKEFNGQILEINEEEEKNIFPFLDAIAEKNSPKVFNELDKLYEQFGSQYLLTMIFYMFRRLIINPKKLPEFILRKLSAQKKNFPLEKIKENYKLALETDFKIKQGLVEERIGLTLLVNKIIA